MTTSARLRCAVTKSAPRAAEASNQERACGAGIGRSEFEAARILPKSWPDQARLESSGQPAAVN